MPVRDRQDQKKKEELLLSPRLLRESVTPTCFSANWARVALKEGPN